MAEDLLGFHVVVRVHREARMATVFTSDDEAPSRARYQIEVDQAARAKAGARVDLRDRLGRCLASYLAPAGTGHSTQESTQRRPKR